MNTIESIEPVDIKLNEKQISDLQKTLDFEISNSYLKLLSKYNVAKPKFTYFKKDNIEFNINYFFGFSENKYRNFINNYNAYQRRMPNELYPVASTNGGDLLCLNKKDGSIYHWFHEENDLGLEGNDEKPYKIADNLIDFLEMLTASEEPTKEEIERAKKQAKITKTTPLALKFKNEARAKKGLPPLTMKDFQ